MPGIYVACRMLSKLRATLGVPNCQALSQDFHPAALPLCVFTWWRTIFVLIEFALSFWSGNSLGFVGGWVLHPVKEE